MNKDPRESSLSSASYEILHGTALPGNAGELSQLCKDAKACGYEPWEVEDAIKNKVKDERYKKQLRGMIGWHFKQK